MKIFYNVIFKRKVLFAIISALLITVTHAGVLNYTRESGGSIVYISSIEASNRAQYIAGEIVKGLDLSDLKNFNTDSINKDDVIRNLGTLGRMTIHNNSLTNATRLKFKIDISTDKEGHIGYFITDPSIYIVTVNANSDTNFSNLDVNDLSTSWVKDFTEDKTVARDWNSIGEDVIASALLAGGDMFPQRTFTIKITLIEAGTTGPDFQDTEYETIVATIYQPLTTGQAALIYPVNDEKIPLSGLNFTFLWQPVAVRTAVNVEYNLYLFEVPENGSAQSAIQTEPILKIEHITDTGLDFPTNLATLEQGNKYAWFIQSIDGEGNKIGTNGLSSIERFEIAIPEPPNLNNPIGEVKTTPIFFSWTGVEGADKYELTVAGDNVFQQTIMDPIETDSIFITVGNENKTFEPSKKYFWKVQALDKQGETLGDASKTESFEFKQYIELQRPIGGEVAMIMPPEFDWSDLDGAEGYNIMIATDPNFGDERVFNVNASSYLGEDTDFFTFDKNYYWKVQATNAGNNWGFESKQEKFKSPERSVPDLIEPANGDQVASIESIRFRWLLVNWASRYDLELYGSDKELLATIEDAGEPPYEYKNADGLIQMEKSYYWKVVASDGDIVKKSGLSMFKGSEATMPLIFAPLGLINQMNEVNFSWEALSWAKGYKLYLADNPNMNDKTEIADLANSPYTYINDGSLKWQKQYYWVVEPYDKNDNTYGNSGVGGFNTPVLNSPELIAPLGEVVPDNKNVKFDWTKPKWAEKYNLLIARSRNMANAENIEIQGEPPFTFSNDVLKLGREYFWQVEAINDNVNEGVSKKSNIAGFRTKAVPALTIIEPRKNVLDSFDSVMVSWTDIEGADGYKLFVSNTEEFSSPIYEGSERSYTLQGLEAGKKYTLKVIAFDENNEQYGVGSPVKVFYTEDKKVVQPAEIVSPIGKINELFPKLKWIAVEGADSYIVKVGDKTKQVKSNELPLEEIVNPIPDKTYRWSVQAYKSGEKYGLESKAVNFTLPYPQITIINPLNKDVDGKIVKLSWNEISYADNYFIMFSKGSNFDNAQKLISTKGLIELKELEPGQYSWQVTGYFNDLEVAKKSVVGTFIVKELDEKGAIQLIDPVNKVVKDNPLVLSWKGIQSASEYKVRFSKGTSFEDKTVFNTKEEIITLKDLLPGNYVWQVQGIRKNGQEINPPSPIATFKYEYAAAVPSESAKTTKDMQSSQDIKEKVTFIEASPADIEAFDAWIHEFLKSNGSSKMLEDMTLKEFLLDGSNSNINNVILQAIINKEIEIKSIEVK